MTEPSACTAEPLGTRQIWNIDCGRQPLPVLALKASAASGHAQAGMTRRPSSGAPLPEHDVENTDAANPIARRREVVIRAPPYQNPENAILGSLIDEYKPSRRGYLAPINLRLGRRSQVHPPRSWCCAPAERGPAPRATVDPHLGLRGRRCRAQDPHPIDPRLQVGEIHAGIDVRREARITVA